MMPLQILHFTEMNASLQNWSQRHFIHHTPASVATAAADDDGFFQSTFAYFVIVGRGYGYIQLTLPSTPRDYRKNIFQMRINAFANNMAKCTSPSIARMHLQQIRCQSNLILFSLRKIFSTDT